MITAEALEKAARLASLTRRQIEVLALRTQGLTYNDIATRLDISSHAVRTHVSQIMRALEVHSTAEMVAVLPALVGAGARSSGNDPWPWQRTGLEDTRVIHEHLERELPSGSERGAVRDFLARDGLAPYEAGNQIHASAPGPRFDPLVETEWRLTFTFDRHDRLQSTDIRNVPLGP